MNFSSQLAPPPSQQQQQSSSTNSGGGSTQQQSSKILTSNHQDYIHHIAFDVYGRRMATCSGDRFVRVWDLTDSGDWNLVGEWQAHRGNVTHIAWAHPEFGSVLGTCGTDSDAKIWEERTHGMAGMMENNAGGSVVGGMMMCLPATTAAAAAAATGGTSGTPLQISDGAGGNNALASRWTIKTQLTEARKAVSCLEFAPRHWGLKLATGSADGCVRIYEAVDIMNLAQWPLAATLQAFGTTASDREAYYDDQYGHHNRHQQLTSQLGVLCLSWCTGRFEPPTLVVGGSHLSVFRYQESSRSWQPLFQIPPSSDRLHILDVAWAPNVGRRFHYIASAEDQHLRVHKLSRTYSSDDNTTTTTTTGTKQQQQQRTTNNNKLKVESSQTLLANAWRCQWNVTGTVLASSGDAGTVQMWKSDNTGNFQCVAQVQGDLTQAAGAGGIGGGPMNE